tara:strand:+ start:1222 stop:2718 length:1497 start_codon:yes stop_codon:yes gene_type:complete
MKKNIFILIAVAFLATLASASAVQCGDTVLSNVLLTEDLTSDGTNDCLTIGANNVKIDCNGYSITGTNDRETGIISANFDNVEITQCTISGFDFSIQYFHSDNGYVHDNTIEDTVAFIGTSSNNNMTNNTLNLVDDISITEGVSFEGSGSSSFTNNVLNYNGDGDDTAVRIASSDNTVSNNQILGVSQNGFGIANLEQSNNNVINGNTISNFGEGLELGSPFMGSADSNTIQDNTFSNNALAMKINFGDLNIVSSNTIDSGDGSLVSGKIGSNPGGWGLSFKNSENNLIFGNTLYDESNIFDINNNVYCYQGQNNSWEFNITEDCQGDCIKPNCTELLDDDSQWFGGGSSLSDINNNRHVKEVVNSLKHAEEIFTGRPEAQGWNTIAHPDAIEGRTHYNTPGNGQLAGWIIHTLDQNLEIKVWKFDNEYSSRLTTAARYDIYHSSGVDTVYIDQTTPGDEWLPLGTYHFDDNGLQGVAITKSPLGFTVADAITIEDAG